MREGPAEPRRKSGTVTPDDRRRNSIVAGWEVVLLGAGIVVTVDIVPVLPIGRRRRRMQVHALFNEVVPACDQAV